MAGNLADIPRTDKLEIARSILSSLQNRQQSGPSEPALDVFITELKGAIGALEVYTARLTGGERGDPTRAALLARADAADVEVDTWLRHIESFLNIEAGRRIGPNVGVARSLYTAVCPDGLAHIDARIVDENAHCRETLKALKDPEHAAGIAAIELPAAWIARFEAALAESEAAIDALIAARGPTSTSANVAPGGRAAEDEWVDLMIRLRKYMGSRSKRTDFVAMAESRAILRPLIDMLQKLRADAASRATKRTVRLPRQSS